ncbi:MAG TPA: DUF262 domain-containing HNH endonuclease family protein [Pyrinomonadaceae bacterium]|nr:DUF262 domain-containing HNH endonuclease family protein [Pyrinomonadaceae bacterium]
MTQFTNFNTVIGNGKSYKIPIYQRDFSWEKDEWEDLWNDIEDIPIDRTHYLGYLVLQRILENEEAFLIIDGQQRITTLSLLSLAVCRLLKDWAESGIETQDNLIRYEEERKRYIGNFSTSRLSTDPKLHLNRNNDDFYQSFLLNLRRPAAISKLKPSQKLLQQAFDYFYEQLSEKFEADKSGAKLSDFLEKVVGTGLIFTIIEVKNEIDAFKVFETLNARGVKLSTADLLKNYLFSKAAALGKLDLDEAERLWQSIADSLRSADLTTFIRHYWNSRYNLERQSTLFKGIRNNITNADESFELLQSLENNVVFYAGFSNPFDEIWDKNERKHLKVLKYLGVTTCYSLMLSVLEFLPRTDFQDVLRELVAVTFRYNISGRNPNEAERIFSRTAVKVSKGELKNVRDIALELKSLYVADDDFAQLFSTVQINYRRKKELIKYILVKMENHLSGKDNQVEDATSTIEHILPENAGSVWDSHFPSHIQVDYINRLGNFTLLEASIKHKLNNEMEFSNKLAFYKTSSFQITKDHLLFTEWSPETLLQRQQKIAKWAKGIWQSSYL